MKNFIWVCIVALSIAFIACNKDSDEANNIPIYSNTQEIINPPDTFILYMPLKSYSNNMATLRFDTNSVWRISKITGQSSNFWIQRTDSTQLIIRDTLVLGLQGNTTYNFYVILGSNESKNKFFAKFEKQPVNYSTFSPKF